jgi:putative ABC transport system permease protein
MNDVDYNLTDVLDIRILAGRAFTDHPEAEQNNIIINEASAKALGFTPAQAIGQKINQNIFTDAAGAFIQYKITGVIANFHRQSLHEVVTPAFLKLHTLADWDTFDHLVIKTSGSDLSRAIAYAESVWKKNVSTPFEFSFLDQNLARLYTEDQRSFRIITVFTVLALLICSLGLYGLSSFVAESRFKEFGIRKVLGASADQIIGLISREFVKLVLVAVLLAAPLSWYLMNEWLQRFTYKTEVDLFIFLYAGAAAILTALLTVSFESLRAAMQNPTKSLRSE